MPSRRRYHSLSVSGGNTSKERVSYHLLVLKAKSGRVIANECGQPASKRVGVAPSVMMVDTRRRSTVPIVLFKWEQVMDRRRVVQISSKLKCVNQSLSESGNEEIVRSGLLRGWVTTRSLHQWKEGC